MFIASLNLTEYNPITWELCVCLDVCVFHGAPNKDNIFHTIIILILAVLNHTLFFSK